MNSDPDVRWQRRALSDEQFAMLIESAISGPAIQCVAGPDRAMLYILAAWTGYRRNELASLTLRSFNLESDPPTVVCRAGYSKRRRNDVIPLHQVLVERLRSWLDAKGDIDMETPIFDLRTKSGGLRRTSKMMRLDLERIGTPYCDEDGLYADFHANRHTFISNLVKAGVTPKITQSVARHSDVNLTMGVYSHVHVLEQAAAINSLPGPPMVLSGAVRNSLVNGLVNTTQEEAAEKSVDHIVDQTSGFACPDMASAVAVGAGEQRTEDEPKPLPQKSLVTLCQLLASDDPQLSQTSNSSGGGIRTPDTRIMIPHGNQEYPEEYDLSEVCAAPGAAVTTDSIPMDSELTMLVEAWDLLPEPVKLGILAMVRAARQ